MIKISDLGKKFGNKWIFRHLNFQFESGSQTAVIGRNGSGKSTLLKILSGYLTPSEGIRTTSNEVELAFLQYAFVAPYAHIIEEMTVIELLQFHSKFKKPIISFEEMLNRAGISTTGNTFISDLSSGMKQRVKLILAFHFQNEVYFLDEPCTNFDQEGIEWYNSEISQLQDKIIIIASNDSREYSFCNQKLSLNLK